MLIIGTLVFLSFSVIIITAIGLNRNRFLKAQQEKLTIVEASEKKYRTLVESMEDCVFLVNKDYNILYWNQHFVSKFGVKETKSGVGNMTDILKNKAIVLFQKGIDAVFKSGNSKKLDIKLYLAGKKLWFEVILIPKPEDGNTVKNVLCIARDITERRRVNKQLKHLISTLQNQQEVLKDLSKEVIRAQEEERKRMSRDLHDEIGQTLTAISVNLEILKQHTSSGDTMIDERIEDCKILVKKTIQEIRQFSHELRPTILDNLGLNAAILSHAKDFSHRTGINIKIKNSTEVSKLGTEIQTVLYRIFQEGLNNISKHAKAENIEISYAEENDKFLFQIVDDGVGFNTKILDNVSSGKGGLGLQGMKERISLIGGSLCLSSASNQGTSILIEIPLGKA